MVLRPTDRGLEVRVGSLIGRLLILSIGVE